AALRDDSARITRRFMIGRAFEKVAVENLSPNSRLRQSQFIVIQTELTQSSDYDYIVTGGFEPAVESDHARCVVHVKRIHIRAAESRVLCSYADEGLHKREEVLHRGISLKTFPPDECVLEMLRIIAPVFIFKNFFAHKQHRYAGCSLEQRRCEAGAAAGIP